MAANSCPPNIQNLMPPMGSTRLCHVAADCTRNAAMAGLPDCCAIDYNGLIINACFSKQYAALAGLVGLKVNCP